jgi:hypothetical protein
MIRSMSSRLSIDTGRTDAAAGPQDFAAEHVADTPGDVLIEQRFGDRCIEIGDTGTAPRQRAEVGMLDTEIGPRRPEAGMAMGVELAVGLDRSSVEAHRRETRRRDAGREAATRLPPSLTVAVQMPVPLSRMLVWSTGRRPR